MLADDVIPAGILAAATEKSKGTVTFRVWARAEIIRSKHKPQHCHYERDIFFLKPPIVDLIGRLWITRLSSEYLEYWSIYPHSLTIIVN